MKKMKRMKQLLALVLCFLMMFSSPLEVLAEENSGDDIYVAQETTEEGEIVEKTTEQFVEEPPVIVEEENVGACEECGQNDGHAEICSQYVAPMMQTAGDSLYEKLLASTSSEEMFTLMSEAMDDDTQMDELWALTFEEIENLRARIAEMDPEAYEEYLAGNSEETSYAMEVLYNLEALQANCECPDCGMAGEHAEDCPWVMGELFAPTNNVHNVTQNKWYATLSAATSAAKAGDTIEVYKSFTESTTVKIQADKLTIRAAEGYHPVISWNKTDAVAVAGATSYNCIVVYTDVANYTIFGKDGSTGSLTFDASGASNNNFKGKRARVLMHCGKKRLYIYDGIIMTGGNTGGGNYDSAKPADNNKFPEGSGEVTSNEGFGAGIYMFYGELVMMGGRIHHNYSLYGKTAAHNFVGAGGGVYLHDNTSMIFSGGTIDYNAAGSGGGGGILVGYDATLEMKGGVVDSNVTRFASGGGIGVRVGAKVVITGGKVTNNYAVNHGGGLFARGDAVPLEITGGTFSGNEAGNDGGAVLFWTVGNDVTKNTVKIGGTAKIQNNRAESGAGISVGREVEDGVPIGNAAKLVIEGKPVISGNIATKNGGGIYMQSDEFSTAVNTVVISGGTISGNQARDGGGIYVPGGTVTMTGGTFTQNKATNRGAGIFTGGGTMTLTNVSFTKNVAANLGGGAYMVGGSIVMNSGTFAENTAISGGAVYVTKVGTSTQSNFTMNDGSFSKNTATENGGAVYVAGGNITMLGGQIQENSAVNGGGAYVTEGNFHMISGALFKNTASEYGGGAFNHGGVITIGVEKCNGQNTNHSITYTTKPHPEVYNNVAVYGGGLAVDGGVVNIYCGEMVTNTSDNDGTGMNIFMYDTDSSDAKAGEINHIGGTVGEETNHGIVVIGGKINIPAEAGKTKIKINYHDNDEDLIAEVWIGEVPEDYYLNLPYCPQEWEAHQNTKGMTFVGWTYDRTKTAPPVSETVDLSFIREDDDYRGLGDPTKIKKVNWKVDENGNYYIDFYAVWATKNNDIIYKYSLDGVTIENNTLSIDTAPDSYEYSLTNYSLDIPDASMAGYKFLGWKMYAEDEGISNWKKDATTYEPTLVEHVPHDITSKIDVKQNFGTIVLLAIFEPAFTDLTIVNTYPTDADYSIDENQVFIYEITGTPTDKNNSFSPLQVMIVGDGQVTIKDIPVGNYTVTEKNSWSWRYNDTNTNSQDVTLSNPDDRTTAVTFINSRTNDQWLSGDSYCTNWWQIVESTLRQIVSYCTPE